MNLSITEKTSSKLKAKSLKAQS